MSDPARPPAGARPRRGVQAGLVAALLCLALAAVLALQPAPLRLWQERVFDRMILAWGPGDAPALPVVVIDIGASDEDGRPWDRTASARLAARLAEAGPAAVGWDIVFAGSCGGDAANAALAAALGRAPTVLGFLLSGAETPPGGPAPALAAAEGTLPRLWSAPGAEGPCPAFVAGGATLAAVSLPGDETARVRGVPAAVNVAGTAWPSLAVEVLRRAGALSMAVLTLEGAAGRPTLRVEGRAFPLDLAGTLRFVPRDRAARAARTLPAEAVLAGFAPAERLQGAVVLVGSSLPQRGGLRPTAADPLYPSVQIAADVVEGLLAGRLPWRPDSAPVAEAAALALGGLAVAVALMRLAPGPRWPWCWGWPGCGRAARWPCRRRRGRWRIRCSRRRGWRGRASRGWCCAGPQARGPNARCASGWGSSCRPRWWRASPSSRGSCGWAESGAR